MPNRRNKFFHRRHGNMLMDLTIWILGLLNLGLLVAVGVVFWPLMWDGMILILRL